MHSAHTAVTIRRPQSTERAGVGESTSKTASAFYGPSSFPRTSGQLDPSQSSRMIPNIAESHRHQYGGEDKGDSMGGRRIGRNSNRLHAHRSLDASELYENDPLLPQQMEPASNALPPADPPATMGSSGSTGLQSSYFKPSSYGTNYNFASSSQGNLLHLDGDGMGHIFSPAHRHHYGRPISSDLTAAASGAFSNPGLPFPGNPYSLQFHQQPYSIPPTSFQLPNNLTFANRDVFVMPLQVLQREYEILRREYENTVQKLNSNMNSIKTFWSPELKKERSLRKEESARAVLIHEQLRMVTQEAQRQTQVIRQLQTELQCQYELSKTIRDTEMRSVSKDQYESIRLERERLHRELTLGKENMRDQEMQIETQRQTLAAKDESIKKLLDMLQAKGSLTYSAAQDRMELEQSRSRQIDLENRCRRYEETLQQKEQDVRSLREECVNASEKLRQMEQTGRCDHSYRTRIGPMNSEMESTALRSMLDAKEGRITQLEQRIGSYEIEIGHLRELRGLGSSPRERSLEKTINEREYEDMKLKMEKMELELGQKKAELQTCQTRLQAAEEQADELRKHVELAKDTITTKEQQVSLLEADMKALRGKLDSRNETVDQKTQQLQQVQLERNRMETELADFNEQLKIRDSKIASLQRKIDSLEDVITERQSQIDLLKQRFESAHTGTPEQNFQDQLENIVEERDRLLTHMREQTEVTEKKRQEEMEIHGQEVRDLRMAIETLQKDITDRQVLIESQQEKISDLTREVTALRSEIQMHAARQADGDFYVNEFERLNRELQEARMEAERLLKTVSKLEKEKVELNAQIRAMEKQIEESQTQYSTTFERKIVPSTATATGTDSTYSSTKSLLDQVKLRQKEQRLEELEEALKESVNITTERESAIAQQKQACQHMESKMNKYKEQLGNFKGQYEELKDKLTMLSRDKQDKEGLIRSMKHEKKRHLEEVLQLKEEALLAAISEKDAQIALLESSQNSNTEEIEGLRRHKEKLIKKLKEENSRRVKLLTEMKEIGGANYATGSSSNPAEPSPIELSLNKDVKSSPVDQDDDTEGIWA